MCDRKYDLRMPGFLQCFFLTIVVVQNVPLRMTDMATGCAVTESDWLTSPEVMSYNRMWGFPALYSGVFEVFRYVV